MAINQYEDIIDGLAKEGALPTSADPIDQAIGQYRENQKSALQQSMFVASKSEPDRHAQVLALSEKTKLPPSLVERNFDELAKKQSSASFNYDRLIDESPGLSNWLQNPDNAAVAKDDIESLKKIEEPVHEYSAMSSMFNSLMSGFDRMNSNLAKAPALVYDAFAIPQNLVAKYADIPELQAKSPDWLMNNPAAKYYDELAKEHAALSPDLNASITEEIGKGNYAKAGRALAVNFVVNAPNQAAIIAMSLMGAPNAGLGFAGVTTAADANAEARAAGADPGMGALNAVTKGTIEAVFENLGTLGVLRHWESAIAKSYGKGISREVMKDFAKTIAYSVAAEGNEEGLTSIAQDFSDYITGVNPDALKGIGQRAADAAIVGGFSGGSMTSVMAGGGHAIARHQEVKHASMLRDTYLAMGEGAEASKLRERLPQKQREFVENIVKDSPVENIFIPIDAAEEYFQSKGTSAAAAMQQIGATQSYEEAKQTGGDIKIPLAQWVDKVVGTEHYQGLANDIKFSPEGMTYNQAVAESQATRAEMERIATEQPAQVENKDTSLEIANKVAEQLKSLGYDEKTAQTNSALVASAFRSLGQRSGVDPLELFNRYGLQIGRGDDAAPIAPPSVQNPMAPEAMASQAGNAAEVLPMPTIEAVQYDEQGNRVFDADLLASLRRVIADGELIQSGAKVDAEGYAIGSYGGASTFPDFFQNKGYTKKETLKVLDKHAKGQKLTEKQQAILEDLYGGYIDGLNRGNLYQDGAGPQYGEFKVDGKPETVTVLVLPESELTAEKNSSIEEARDYASNNLRNQSVRNEMTHWDIHLSQKGFNEIGRKGNNLQTRIALTHADELMKNAIYDGAEAVEKGKRGIKAYHRFYAPMTVGGTEYLVRIKVAETDNGLKFYHEIAVENERPAGASGADQALSGAGGLPAVSGSSMITIQQFADSINATRHERQWFQSAATNSRAPVFYSKLTQLIEQKMGGSADPAQILAMIRDIKEEERKWSGIDEFLKGKKKVTKAELLDFLRANELQIQEVTKGGVPNFEAEKDALIAEMDMLEEQARDAVPTAEMGTVGRNILIQQVLEGDDGALAKAKTLAPDFEWQRLVDVQSEYEQLQEQEAKATESAATSYDKYVLPGGENYREVLFTLPEPQREKITFSHDQNDWQTREAKPITFGDQKPERGLIHQLKVDGSNANTITIREWPDREPGKRYEPKVDDYDANKYLNAKFHASFEEAAADAEQALNQYRQSLSPDVYKSSHWNERNVLAHTRLSDRVDADGKRALHVEEIQSDWHQDGRKKGYKTDNEMPSLLEIEKAKERVSAATVKLKEALKPLDNLGFDTPTQAVQAIRDDADFATRYDFANETNAVKAAEEYRQAYQERVDLEAQRDQKRQAVPDAPFKKTWHEFVLKRLIRMAAEHGYDRIVWTPGEQQADRYDLAKQVDAVLARKNFDGTYWVAAKKDGRTIQSVPNAKESELEGFFGKDLAEKIIKQEGKETEDPGMLVYSGVDLKVGGDGMKGFYDKMIPDFLNKFGKKYGAKVGTTQIATDGSQNISLYTWQDEDTGVWHIRDADKEDRLVSGAGQFETEEDALQFIREQGSGFEGVDVHSFDITPELRDAALNEGFSLFQGENAPRGRIRFGSNRQFRIDLFKSADLSTFLHETGHFYMEVMADLATAENAPEQLRQDYQTILDWLGVKSRSEITVEHHEKWARGFERYLMEGKAPTSALAEAFARMRTWLLSVYRQIKNLDVEITDEIRGVMDRMLATQEEIDAVYGAQSMDPLFTDPIAAGMSEKEAEAYRQAAAEAKESAQAELTAKTLAEFKRQRDAWWKEQRKKVRAEFEAQVSAEPIYKALQVLQTGTLPDGSEGFKLSKAAVIEAFGDEVLKKLPRPYVYTVEGGVHPDVAAEMLGFGSGEELVKAMIAAEKKNAKIDRLTDEKMTADFGDMMNDGTLEESARRAVHNEARAKVLRLELQHLASNNLPVLKTLIKRIARRVPSEQAIREQAAQIVGGKTVADLKPYVFERAEIKAAKEAGEALAKGDIEAAFEAKRRELLNHELFRAANDAQEQVDKALEKFKKLWGADEDIAKVRDMDLVNAGRAILAQFGLGKANKPVAFHIEQIRRYDPDTAATVDALIQGATAEATDYKAATLEQFITMAETVQTLWDLAKTSRQFEIDGVKLDRAKVMAELMQRLSDLSLGATKPGLDRAVSDSDKTKMGLLGWRAALRRVESWATRVDGGDRSGPFTRYFINPVMEATTRYRLAKQDQLTKFLEIIKPIEKTLVKRDIPAPELGYTFSGKSELLGAVLHTGNKSNFEKLLLGRQWGIKLPSGDLDASRWNGFIARMYREGILTKADYDAVQGIWDLLEATKPEAQKAHKKMYGHYFSEITANEVVTPFGTYRGGYVPAMTDPFIVEDSAIRADKETLEKNNNSFMFPTAGRGFTKSRVENYHQPLAMDLRLIPSHLDKVMRFVHIEPVVKDIGRIVMNKDFRAALSAYDPAAAGDMLVPWLQRTAQQKIVLPSSGLGGKFMDRAARFLRRSAGMQAMVLNVTNAMQNVTGFSLAALKVRPKYLADSLWTYVRQPGTTTSWITEKSNFMKTKVGEQAMEVQKEIDDIILNPDAYDRVKDAAIKHGYVLQIVSQNIIEIVTWAGAYNEAIEKGMTEKEAIRAADSAVRETQGAMNPEDVSRAETGTAAMRLFTMFYSYFNMQANLLGTELSLARDMGLKKGASRGLYVYTMGFMVPAVLAELIVRAMSGSPPDEDGDGEYLDEVLSVFFGSQFRTATAMFPFVGQVASAGVNMWNDKQYDDRISTSPAIAMLERSVKAPLSIYKAAQGKGTGKAAIQDSLTALGMMTGVPLTPIGKPAGYLADIASGKAQPTGPIDLTRGLVTGKTPKK